MRIAWAYVESEGREFWDGLVGTKIGTIEYKIEYSGEGVFDLEVINPDGERLPLAQFDGIGTAKIAASNHLASLVFFFKNN